MYQDWLSKAVGTGFEVDHVFVDSPLETELVASNCGCSDFFDENYDCCSFCLGDKQHVRYGAQEY